LLHHIAFSEIEAHCEAGDFCTQRRGKVWFYRTNDFKLGSDRLFDHFPDNYRGWSSRTRLGGGGQGAKEGTRERHEEEYQTYCTTRERSLILWHAHTVFSPETMYNVMQCILHETPQRLIRPSAAWPVDECSPHYRGSTGNNQTFLDVAHGPPRRSGRLI
jgi:hypothetical protein